MSDEEAIFTVCFALVAVFLVGGLAGYGWGWNAGHAAAKPKKRALFPEEEVRFDSEGKFSQNHRGVK